MSTKAREGSGGMAEELRKEWTVKSHVTHFPTER
jgi:hypothetical protein